MDEHKDLVEFVAEVLYRHSSGMTDEEYATFVGKPRKQWEATEPWDTDPNGLCEHERDEYRLMAKATIHAIAQCQNFSS